MRVLGIDPGFGRIGWAIIDGSRSRQELVEYGCLETESNSALALRLGEIYDFMLDLIGKYKPVAVAVEDIFYFKNQKTVIGVAQARGVILLAVVKAKVMCFNYSPLQVKSTIAGYGKADKRQVQLMVKTQLGLKVVPKPDDAADAAAVALTHFFVNPKMI